MCTCAHMYSQSCEYKGGRTMHPMQYLTLQQCIYFYYGQFTLSVHTNLIATDHFQHNLIKTNEGHMLIGIHYKFYDCVHTSMQLNEHIVHSHTSSEWLRQYTHPHSVWPNHTLKFENNYCTKIILINCCHLLHLILASLIIIMCS